ncbi:MAG: hypothetical protein Q9160_007263 [Pyrenula sp. 1 TL-2023]
MHERYGPIIRINPNELHIADPDYYDTVYTGASRVTDKYPPSAGRFGNTFSFFATVDHYEHRRLRAPISPFFSKQSILKFSNDILNVSDHLLERLRECADKGKLVDLRDAYTATTADIITEYSFCKRKNALQHEDFMPMLFKGAIQSAEMTHVFFQMPWVLPMMNLFPKWLVKIMSPGVGFVMDWLANYQRDVDDFIASSKEDSKFSHPTILHSLLNDPNLSATDKASERVGNEAMTIVQAGYQTTSDTLRVTTFYLLSQPECLAKVRAELATVPFDDNTPTSVYLTKLEKLPYFTAVITESLRTSFGTPTRLQRISPHTPLIYPTPSSPPASSSSSKTAMPANPSTPSYAPSTASIPDPVPSSPYMNGSTRTNGTSKKARTEKTYIIPPGTPVSMVHMAIHNDPTIYPRPEVWDPERWLTRSPGEEVGTEKVVFNHSLMQRYMVAFSKGTRACVGKELAWAELYLVLARIFNPKHEAEGKGRVELKLRTDLTDERDVIVEHDCFNPQPATGRGSVWVSVEKI